MSSPTSPSPSPKLLVRFDLRFTRRYRQHLVVNEEGVTVRAFREVNDLLNWLRDQGETAVFILWDEDRALEVRLGPLTPLPPWFAPFSQKP